MSDEKRLDLGIYTAYAEAVEAGYTGTEEEFADGLARSADYANNAAASAEAAATSEANAEAWATGASEEEDEPSATNNAKYYSGQASASAEAAGTAKTGAETARDLAARWATGGTTGTPGESNNAKYYSEQAATSATAAATASTNFAPTYSSSATYAVGDYVLYNGDLYRCTTAISTAEAWTAAHWTSVKLGPELADVKSALAYPETLTFTAGAINSSGGIISQTANKEVISQKIYGVDKISVSLTFPNAHNIYAWAAQYKADGTFIERTTVIGTSSKTSASGSTVTDENCAYIILCFRTFDDTYTITTDIVNSRLKSTAEQIPVILAGLDGKQDKEAGKGLSKNDFTDAYKAVVQEVDAMINPIPSYWDAEIAASEASIIANRVSMGAAGVEFFFVTDPHWKEYGSVVGNEKHSGDIIGKLSKDLEIPLVVCGGDVILGHKETKAAAIAEINDFYSAYNKGIKLITTIGNHDTNENNNSSHPEAYLSDGEIYALMQRRMEDFMDTTGSIDHSYYDNASQKVRYIQFNHYGETWPSNNSYAIANWIKAKVQELPEGWTVVLFSHSYFKGSKDGQGEITVSIPNGCAAWAQWFAALQAEADTKAKIACWIVGHVHQDLSDTTNGILVISSNCDCAAQSAMWGGLTMTPGTDTEQCIDCFQLDTAHKTIKVTRIGAGSNRSFDYDPSSYTFGEIS